MKQIKCSYCNHEWKTNSELKYVSCSSCMRKLKNPNAKELKEDNLDPENKEE